MEELTWDPEASVNSESTHTSKVGNPKHTSLEKVSFLTTESHAMYVHPRFLFGALAMCW
jgi:hypothetical protein